MPLAILNSRALDGLQAAPVTVEVHLAGGLPGTTIVGLPEAAVKESRDRVRSAIQNSGFEYPARRITVNLAPADLPKSGGGFDLPIALGILLASGQIPAEQLEDFEIVGELALSGQLREVRGALPTALACPEHRQLLLPMSNAQEAQLAGKAEIRSANSLLEVTAALHDKTQWPVMSIAKNADESAPEMPDMADVRGQEQARRALEIAAAGGHALLMLGPPGAGKSMLAERLPGILPPMSDREAIEAASVASIGAQGIQLQHWRQRPYRAPHHTASAVALVGGGSTPKPGEISLAHHGVLFLDELPEFDRKVLEVLREPLENGRIVISRAAQQAEFPARFQLIAAMNPCPCGHLGDLQHSCRCTLEQIERYRARISGPLLDRIDIHLQVPRVSDQALLDTQTKGENSESIRQRVIACRDRQLQRQGKPNAQLSAGEVEAYCLPDDAGMQLLQQGMKRLGLSARGTHRVLKVARTLADMAGTQQAREADIAEALGYRQLDRQQ